LEKIIATEISPTGINNEIILYLERNADELKIAESILYFGFPVFKDYEDISIKSNFCILSKHHGIILISTSGLHDIASNDENLSQLYSFIGAALKKSRVMRKSKSELLISLDSYTYCSENFNPSDDIENNVLFSLADIHKVFIDNESSTLLPDAIFSEARSIIEGAKAITRSNKRSPISDDPKSKLNILINLEKEVSNFDIDQRRIAISLVNGPQRIRGLAGSGKTIVLAMKAAHIHLQHPSKKILFTFYTKSLYNLIKETIARFYRHFAGQEPNWDNIDILHAWGGRSIDGVCYNASLENNFTSIALPEAKGIDRKDPFSAVCSDALKYLIKDKYNYILIDEAQDLPNQFFQICYRLAIGSTGIEKNIIWAYDDLQSIFNVYQRTPQELFGVDDSGEANVDLKKFSTNLVSGQSNDLVLFKCYRNPLEVLVTAHALGLGIYSSKPVQMLENKEHWEDVGYKITENESLTIGSRVVIKRPFENSPLSINKYQNSNEIIQHYQSTSIQDESKWIATNIKNAINEGIKPHDILVICLDDRCARGYFNWISQALTEQGIRSNNLLTSRVAAPPFSLKDMVTLSTVHRAKGNEASMVFAAGIDAIYPFRDTRNGRNKLFTAFTRTKAWLRISGLGEKAKMFFDEIDKSLENSPDLEFIVPDAQKIETIQRDLDSRSKEIVTIESAITDLEDKGLSSEEIKSQIEILLRDRDDG
jgi:superfamily I DNA and RNA helicase